MAGSANKRVAKNAVALTIRMILVTCVGLYTSRIILKTLGIDDYGIYGVVGGIVSIASFLNTSMAGATSRFITFALGENNLEKLKLIFSTAFIIHCIIALCILILAETIGLWFLNNKMVFPPDRMFAVNVLYQLSIISMIISYTQVPYTAEILAHEDMNIYAYIEIFNSSVKLGIALSLYLFNSDRLIVYAIMTLTLGIVVAMFYRLFCLKKYPESHLSLRMDKSVVKEMITFSGFDMFGNMCTAVKGQGQPIILNLFFGVMANAASSIALTVSQSITALTTVVAQAFRPQIIKQYAANEIENMRVMMIRAVTFSILAYSFVAIPIFSNTSRVLYLWLGEVPEYSVIFVRFLLISSLFNTITSVTNAAIHATGNIKNISFYSGSLHLLSLGAGYIAIKFTNNAWCIYAIGAFFNGIIMLLNQLFLKLQIKNLNIKPYSYKILKCLLIVVAICATICLAQNYLPEFSENYHNLTWLGNLGILMINIICSLILLGFFSFTLVLPRNEVRILFKYIKNKL